MADFKLKKTEWQSLLKQCETSDELNSTAAEIAAEMQTEVPDQSTVLEVMATLTSHPKWDKKTNPILSIAQNENKMDTIPLFG